MSALKIHQHARRACSLSLKRSEHSIETWWWSRSTSNVGLSSLLQVIYALNTKNDEHEAAIATLKEAHEEEVQQILSETREKILQVKVMTYSTF